MNLKLLVFLSAVALISQGEVTVKEVYSLPVAPPLRRLPLILPNPPTPQELEAAAAQAAAVAAFNSARDAYLAKIGFTNFTDLAAITNAANAISQIDVVRTATDSDAGKITTVIEGE